MNSRIRALVWEEIRVGGSIVAVCLAVGLIVMVRMRLTSAVTMPWNDALSVSRGIATWLPVVCALLLVLNLRNSGHLGGGFSRCILRMPVDTAEAVTVPMVVRLAEVMALGAALFLAFRLLFGQAPGWRTVLVLGMLYLLAQAVDWVRGLATWLVFALAAAVAVWVLQYTGRWVWFFDFLDGMEHAGAPVFLAGFAGVAGACYGVSLAAVGHTRRGWRIDPSKGASIGALLGCRDHSDKGVFSSPRAAQFWYEMRRTRLLLPKAALLLWLPLTAGYWMLGALTTYVPPGKAPSIVEVLAEPTVTELFPLLALLLAAVAWRMQTSWIGWRENRQSVSGWMSRHPVTKAQAARARLAVAGVNLGITLGAAGMLYMAAFLLCEHAAILRLLEDAWAIGATSPREMAALLLGPVLLAGLLAWIVMTLPTGVIGFLLAACLLVLTNRFLVYDVRVTWSMGGAVPDFWYGLWSKPLPGFNAERSAAFVMVFPICLYLTTLTAALRLGWIRRRSALLSVALWLGLAGSLFPFRAQYQGEQRSMAVLLCLSIAALAVECWPETVLRGVGGLRVALRRQSPAQHGRGTTSSPGRWLPQAALLAVFCAGVMWMRWPAEPVAQALLRAQGLPATLTELNAWYTPVPREENLAVKYREVKSFEGPLEDAWRRAHAFPAKNQPDPAQGEIWSKILVQGDARVKRTERIPQDVWVATKDYWDMVGRTVAEKLHAVAQSGLHKSRYPIDLREGPGTPMEHLAPLRHLARVLAVEGWVAAVERRPHEVATSVLDTFPIADSLAGEPMLLSQFVRVAVMNIALGNLENSLNRCNLPDEELARLADGLRTVLPPLAEGPFLNRAVAGEECFMICGMEHPVTFLDYSENGLPYFLRRSPARQGLSSAMEVAGIGCLDRAMIGLLFRDILDKGLAAAKSGMLPEVNRPTFWETTHLRYHAPLASMPLSGSGNWLEVEWRIRTQLDIARTVLAVERYRLVNGRLPERLEELVPAFIERVSADPWNGGKPLSYRVKEDGEYVVYSFGHNKTDEQGEEMNNWWSKGDATFTVAPVEARAGVMDS